MGSGKVRWRGTAEEIHCRAGVEGVDAIRNPVAVCIVVGTAENKIGNEPGDHTLVPGDAAEWQGATRAGGMGCALLAQCYLALCSDFGPASAGAGAIRLQLALGHGHRMLLCRHCFRLVAGPKA